MMKRTSKKLISLLAALLLCLLSGSALAAEETEKAQPLPFLKTKGEQIVDEKGTPVILRGTNFGGWGIMEDWFCPYTSPSGEEEMFQTLVKRFGIDGLAPVELQFLGVLAAAQRDVVPLVGERAVGAVEDSLFANVSDCALHHAPGARGAQIYGVFREEQLLEVGLDLFH